MPPVTTLSDLRTAVHGFVSLCDKAIELGHGLIPHRISQDVLENFFGHQRQACGSNSNMTGKL